MYSRGASAFEASKKGLVQTRYVDKASVYALETGSVLLLEINRKIQIGIGSSAAVTVFSRMVADFPTLETPGKANSCRFGRTVDLSARKVKGKLRDVSLWYVNPRMAEVLRVLMAVSEMSDMSHDVFFPRSNRRYQSVCTPRGLWNETGAGVKRRLRVASGACSALCSDDWEELQFRFVHITFRAGTDRGHDEHDCMCTVLDLESSLSILRIWTSKGEHGVLCPQLVRVIPQRSHDASPVFLYFHWIPCTVSLQRVVALKKRKHNEKSCTVKWRATHVRSRL